MSSRTADAVIAKAEESYELGLISTTTLENVTRRALTEPGYNAILELPLDSELEDARSLERKAARKNRTSLLRRLLHV